jgi:hypothetical protein
MHKWRNGFGNGNARFLRNLCIIPIPVKQDSQQNSNKPTVEIYLLRR